jgi:UDP-N-acetylmuramoylalanine--D-glutamate ligase
MELNAGQRVFVMGLARSGYAVARLLLFHGCTVVVNEGKNRSESEPDADALQRIGATVVFGGHPLSLLEPRPDFVVKNPGIPYDVPLLQEAMRLGIPIYTEIEVASWVTDSPIIAITGSNGKTTTTTLVGEILQRAQQNPVVAGNIGTVLSGVVGTTKADQPIVLEVSSFQLMGTETFHPRIGALLNIYPAHLDYHHSFEAYVDAKMHIFRNMGEQDVAILNHDSALIRQQASTISARRVWFSREQALDEGAFIEDGNIVYRAGGETQVVMPLSSVALNGEHNLENVLAAIAIAMNSGVSVNDIEYVLSRFRGVEHRLEWVRTLSGVDYYNDSKATNPTAAMQALRSFSGDIVWIAGGLDRGDDFSVMADELSQRVKVAVLLGQSSDALEQICEHAGIQTVQKVRSLDQAVMTAKRLANPGDVVLLSPACASWDMFTSFEERGRIFKDVVHTL